MSDKDKAIDAVLRFLKDDKKKMLLVRGYDNDAKLRVVLSCLNEVFDIGIIRTSSMSEISGFINQAFKRKVLPESVKSTAIYKMGRMKVNINSYTHVTRNNPPGNEDCFTLFYPVQLVLDDPKRYKEFLTDLKRMKSRKVILVTTNEWSIKEWDIEKHVDEEFFYSVEDDNPQIMTNLRRNGAI